MWEELSGCDGLGFGECRWSEWWGQGNVMTCLMAD